MELDNIKDLWERATPADTPEVSLEKQTEIRMPLEKIRKNMRMEFWVTVASVSVLLAVSPVLLASAKGERFLTYYIAFLLSFLLIITFFFTKFFRLYRDLENTELSTRDSLKDLIWNFKLNEQYYLSYYVSTVPIILFEIAIFMDYLPGFSALYGISFAVYFAGAVLFTVFILYAFGKFWFRNYYGKYIYKISKTLKIIEINENA